MSVTDSALPVEVRFDAPSVTTDGGLLWVRLADDAIGVCETMSTCIDDSRRPETTRHPILELLRQRIYQIVAGYEDQDDADLLREGTLSELVCGRDPAAGAERAALASQPTLLRLETKVRRRECHALSLALVDLYIQERGRATANGQVKQVRLDLDSMADPVHGAMSRSTSNRASERKLSLAGGLGSPGSDHPDHLTGGMNNPG